MFLLDTNVVSELRRPPRANPRVLAWAQSVPVEQTHLSVISILEIETGIGAIARRDQLQGDVLRRWVDETLLPHFLARILPIDVAIARRCAALHVPDPKSDRDALIAATALVHDMTVVTRNLSDFSATGVRLLDPGRHPA